MVDTFKEDVKRDLVHMKSLLQLVDPPFQRGQRKNGDEVASNAFGGAVNVDMGEVLSQ